MSGYDGIKKELSLLLYLYYDEKVSHFLLLKYLLVFSLLAKHFSGLSKQNLTFGEVQTLELLVPDTCRVHRPPVVSPSVSTVGSETPTERSDRTTTTPVPGRQYPKLFGVGPSRDRWWSSLFENPFSFRRWIYYCLSTHHSAPQTFLDRIIRCVLDFRELVPRVNLFRTFQDLGGSLSSGRHSTSWVLTSHWWDCSIYIFVSGFPTGVNDLTVTTLRWVLWVKDRKSRARQEIIMSSP